MQSLSLRDLNLSSEKLAEEIPKSLARERGIKGYENMPDY